jgi:DNA-binding transcriptional MerR regulator
MESYMTVSEVAKKMNTTVRTLQYYDKEGILKPSGGRESGRRLYSNKDIVRLHQIQSMKYLGFSLADIKTRLPAINTPEEVTGVLSEQASAIRDKISALTDILESIEKLSTEVCQMNTVDWETYANIIILLQAKDDFYWMMKYFNSELLERVKKLNAETNGAFVEKQKKMFAKAGELQRSGLPPESEQVQAFIKDFWDMMMKFTKGDIDLLSELSKLSFMQQDGEWKRRREFMENAMTHYFSEKQ